MSQKALAWELGVYTGENANINIIYIIHVVKQELCGQFTKKNKKNIKGFSSLLKTIFGKIFYLKVKMSFGTQVHEDWTTPQSPI